MVRGRLPFGAMLCSAAALLLLRAADVPLFDPDESRFARTSVEMLRSGDLVVPHFGGEPRLAKPPLLHWLQSAIFSVTGPREWAARLPAIGATLGTLLLVGAIARRQFGPEGRLWAVAIAATMPLVFMPGRVGGLDALLAVHVLAAIALDLTSDERAPAPYRPAALGALLGLAFLTKGPVGVILPCVIMLAGRAATRRSLLPSLGHALQGAAAFAAVALPWGLALLHRVGFDAVVATVETEVLERYFAGEIHTEPRWFLLAVAAVGSLPWLAPLGLGLGRAFKLRHEALSRPALYSGAGLIAGLLFFTIAPSQLASYVAPLAPLAALVVTWELGRELERPEERVLGPTLLAATLTAIAALLVLAATTRLSGVAREVAAGGAAIYAAGGIFALVAALRRRPRPAYASAAVSTALFFALGVWVLYPALAERRSAAALIRAVPELASGRPLVTVEVRVPSLMFYLDRVPAVLDMGQLSHRLEQGDRPLLVMAEFDLPALPPALEARLELVGQQGKYVVLQTVEPQGPSPDG